MDDDRRALLVGAVLILASIILAVLAAHIPMHWAVAGIDWLPS